MFRRGITRFCQSPLTNAAAAAAANVAPGPSPNTPLSAEQQQQQQQQQERKQRRFKAGNNNDDRWTFAFNERGQFFAAFTSVGIISLGCSFLFVPIFRLYCAPSGRGFDARFYSPETTQAKDDTEKAFPTKKKLIKIRFLADIGNTMPIAFVPLQREIEMLIGEPGLAFYSAYNRTSKTLLGVSSYTISPPEATNYLNKIQCFCFEEQRFKPHELVEMPVFFYIDKDFLNDPLINWLDELIVNYTFFNLERTKEHVMNAPH